MTPQRWTLVAVVAGFVLFAGGFAVGRGRQPAVKTAEHVASKEDLLAQQQIRDLTAQLETLKKNTHRVTVTRRNKDGSSERTDTVDTQVDRTKAVKTDLFSSAAIHEARSAESTKTVTSSRPDWRVGVLVGGTLGAPLLPIAGPLTVGVLVERRILGPFSLGVWGLSSGQAGALLSVEF